MATTEKCVVDKEQMEVCFSFGAALKVGWEWEQDSVYPSDTEGLTQGQYTFDLNIYSEQEAEFEFKLFLDRLLSFTPSFTIDKFKAALKLGVNYFYDTNRMCFYGVLSLEDFNVDTKMRLALITWRKNVIESLWSYDNWSSREALIFDDISLSSEEEVTLWERSVDALEDDIALYGTQTNTDTDCIPGTIGSSAGFNYGSIIANNVAAYLQDAPTMGVRNEVLDYTY